jgi:hypothetical protein
MGAQSFGYSRLRKVILKTSTGWDEKQSLLRNDHTVKTNQALLRKNLPHRGWNI